MDVLVPLDVRTSFEQVKESFEQVSKQRRGHACSGW
jgi:hypothetical protein